MLSIRTHLPQFNFIRRTDIWFGRRITAGQEFEISQGTLTSFKYILSSDRKLQILLLKPLYYEFPKKN